MGRPTADKVHANKSWPADAVERRAIASLTPYASNARTHTDEQVKQIAASMREWGWTNPILVDEAGVIIAGHGRLSAAQSLGWGEAPVMVATGWTEAQKRAYTLADNQLAMNAGWDFGLLATELHGLDDAGFDLDLLGFSDVDALMADKTVGETDPDDIPEAPADPVSRPGDIWVLGRHRILCGDSCQADAIERLLGDVRPHLMVTDPPYGVEYDPKWRADVAGNKNTGKLGVVLNDDRADWRDAWALFPGDVAYVWHDGRRASEVQASLEASDFEIRCQIIWAKERFALSRGHYHWQHEPCWYAVRNGAAGHWSGDRSQSTLWKINAREDGGSGHGTQKPVECMKRPIENNSSPGQAIYEPFSGSGTTIIACEMTGRHCYAVELSPAYVDVAVQRWQDFTGKQATLESDGRLFSASAE